MAEHAYTTTALNLRAGPDTEYPLVRWVPEGTAVEVHGCLANYQWCDVQASGDRGWMSAAFLVYPYQSSNVPIVSYGPLIGLPLVGFAFGSYWDDHYRRRPWYDDRHRWARHYRPEYDPPRYRQPPQSSRYYPDRRSAQLNPPSARPPEFRPPQVQSQQIYPAQNRPDYRQPDYRQPDYRQPDYRQPDYRQPDYRQPDYRQQNRSREYRDERARPPQAIRPPERQPDLQRGYRGRDPDPTSTRMPDGSARPDRGGP